MRKNVKVLSLILAGAMAMSLAGCSGSGSKDSAKETAAKSEAKEAGAESSGPVSYTHLDVYKRQGLHRAAGGLISERQKGKGLPGEEPVPVLF